MWLNRGLFFNIVSLVVHTLLPSVLGPICQKSPTADIIIWAFQPTIIKVHIHQWQKITLYAPKFWFNMIQTSWSSDVNSPCNGLQIVWFGLVLWHINHCWLFNINPVFTHILNTWFANMFCRFTELNKQTVLFLTIQFSISQQS